MSERRENLYAQETVVSDKEAVEKNARGFCPACHQIFDEVRKRCPHDRHRLLLVDGSIEEHLGRTIAGRLTLLGLVGAGGMGTVFRAYQHSMRREVAVKLMHPSFSADAELVSRFMREAKGASRLAHPNIITLFDFGQSDDGELYLVMELLEGRTLRNLIVDEAPLAVERALAITSQVCDALHAAHHMGIVHRDIKPENVFIVEGAGQLGEFVKVIDFGLARIAGEVTMDRATPAGVKAGTPAYMAPEQILGDPTDERTDVYAAGAVLHEMLTGQVPFQGELTAQLLLDRVTKPAPAMSTIFSDDSRPEAVDELVAHCLATKPGERLASSGLLKRRLWHAVGQVWSPPPGETADERRRLASRIQDARMALDDALERAHGVGDADIEARTRDVRQALRELEKALGEDAE